MRFILSFALLAFSLHWVAALPYAVALVPPQYHIADDNSVLTAEAGASPDAADEEDAVGSQPASGESAALLNVTDIENAIASVIQPSPGSVAAAATPDEKPSQGFTWQRTSKSEGAPLPPGWASQLWGRVWAGADEHGVAVGSLLAGPPPE